MMEFTLSNLNSCKNYKFTLSEVGSSLTSETSAKTQCVQTTTVTTTTTTTSSTTTLIPPQLEPIKDVILSQEPNQEGTLLKLNWDLAASTSVRLIIESQPINFEATKDFPAELEDEHKVFFLNIPEGQKFNISMKATFLNGTSDVVWSQKINSVINEDKPFDLSEFKIEIEAKENRGSALASWIHTKSIIDTYAIRIVDHGSNLKGEQMLQAPKVTEKAEIDLHSIAGMLNLQNCHNYTLWIYPDTFENLRENVTIWSQGNETNFIYQNTDKYGPNTFDISEAITMETDEENFSLTWDEEFICKPLALQIIQMPYLYKNHSEHLDTVITNLPDYQSGQLVNLNTALPCMTHRYELLDSQKVIHTEEFKTLPSEKLQKLQDREVYVKADTTDYEVLTIEWADRCVDTYALEICQFPYDCSKEKESFHYRAFEVSKNESYPRQTVTDLLPCAFYSYDISNDDFLLYNGSFVTPFSDEDFDLNLMDFQVNQQGLSMAVSWTHVHPCISSYNVGLMDSQGNVLTEIAVDGAEIRVDFNTSVYVSFEDQLEQCAHYDLTITPFLNVNHTLEENWIFKHPVLLFNEPQPPTLFSVKSQDEEDTVLEWDHLPCYEFYELAIYKDSNATLVTKHTITASKDDTLIDFAIQDLKACTAYTFLINR